MTFAIPHTVTPTTCASCRAPIAWVVTAKGKRMPVNWPARADADGVRRGESHFATCPEADAWRKPR